MCSRCRTASLSPGRDGGRGHPARVCSHIHLQRAFGHQTLPSVESPWELREGGSGLWCSSLEPSPLSKRPRDQSKTGGHTSAGHGRNYQLVTVYATLLGNDTV